MGKELTTVQNNMKAIESALSACSIDKLREMSLMERTITLAESMAVMRANFQGAILDRVKGLRGTPLGFLTDEGGRKEPYRDDVIRDCVVEAMLRGAQPIGNEFNVIAGRCYLTKNYFERQLRQFPGLTELRLVEGVPQVAQNAGGALVPYRATWKLHGRSDAMNCVDDAKEGDSRIAVRVNGGMGIDAILGKAKRKMLARIFARVTGSDWVDTDSEPAVDIVEQDQEPFQEPQFALEESKPEEVATSTQELFRGIHAVLGAMELVSDVDKYQASASALLTTEQDFCTLADFCDKRREEIRGTRGERSNGKE